MFANLNLDTVGRLDGGAITLLGADSASEWPFIFSGASASTGIATTVTKAVNASDDTAFVEAGVPGVQFFGSTAADYHRPSDTADKIDVAGLVKVEVILREAAQYLASRPSPLHFTGSATPAGGPPPAGVVRRASTGIVPDMTYSGPGVQIGGIVPGSGAERAKLRVGDQLLAIGGVPTPDLRALAEALKSLTPGDEVDVELSRDGKSQRARLTVGER
jgi:membrane-associated protease RseP (regulator of RpoE activity)